MTKKETGINRDDWNRFVLENGGSFLQSWEWGEFQKSVGRKTFYLKSEDWQVLLIKHDLPFGKSYLYCPRGPIISSRFKVQSFLEKIEELAKQESSIFIRVEPAFKITEADLKELHFIKSKDVQPSRTLVLDLEANEEELLAQMHEKTRYNIGLAQRKGVKIRKTEYNENDFDELWRLINQTYKRQRIRSFSKEYYRKQAQINSENFHNFLFLAEYQNKIISVNLINFFGQTATYLHGGSDNEYRALMAPHLLQWEQIKFAKNQGCKFYDFWGIDEVLWPGITRFKKGFGGQEINYIGCWDFVFKPSWYKIYNLSRNILR